MIKKNSQLYQKRWKEIMDGYNNRNKQMRDEAEKVNPLVDYTVQHEEKVTEKPVVKKNTDTA